MTESLLHLAQYDIERTAGVAFRGGLAHTQDRRHARGGDGGGTAANHIVVFLEDVAAFRMTYDHVADGEKTQHLGGNLAGEGALGLVVHVLRAEHDRRTGQRLRRSRDRNSGWRDHHVAIGGEDRRVAIEFGADGGNERARFDGGQVHLPVSGKQFPAHSVPWSAKSLDAGEFDTLEVLERRAAAGRDMREATRPWHPGDRCRSIA